jgi:hypothetical protein
MPTSPREARLRAEFAGLYPGLTNDEWRPAADLAGSILARPILNSEPGRELEHRLLSEEHFEFRGGDGGGGAGRRWGDRVLVPWLAN